MGESDTYYLDVDAIVAETPYAFGITMDGGTECIWIPKSQVRNRSDEQFAKGDEDCRFEIPQWLANSKGF